MNIEKLETKRLKLVAVTMADKPSYLKYFVDYEVIRFLSTAVPWPYPDDGVDFFINEMVIPLQGKTRWTWGIHLKDQPELGLIGAIDLFKEGKPEHRGFWLGRDFWGNGYMSEAAEVVNRYAFEKAGFEKLLFANAVGNGASSRIKEKTGAKKIKIIDSKFVDPQFTQSEIWELSRENWLARQRSFKESEGIIPQ